MIISADLRHPFLSSEHIAGTVDVRFPFSTVVRTHRLRERCKGAELVRDGERFRNWMREVGCPGSQGSLNKKGLTIGLSDTDFGQVQEYARLILLSPRDLALRIIAHLDRENLPRLAATESQPPFDDDRVLQTVADGKDIPLTECSFVLLEKEDSDEFDDD